MKLIIILGVKTEDKKQSMKDKLKRKKYIGVCRCEFNPIRVIMPRFPSTVTIYITKNRKNRGSWRSGLSVNPNRTK